MAVAAAAAAAAAAGGSAADMAAAAARAVAIQAEAPAPAMGSSGKWDQAPVENAEKEMTDTDDRISIEFPQDEEKRALIERTAKYVCKDGQAIENLLRERERTNPLFSFLFDMTSPEVCPFTSFEHACV